MNTRPQNRSKLHVSWTPPMHSSVDQLPKIAQAENGQTGKAAAIRCSRSIQIVQSLAFHQLGSVGLLLRNAVGDIRRETVQC
jgi:hypothetical protein